GGGERPCEHAAEARRDHLRTRQAGCDPGPDAARARHELADRLAEIPGFHSILTAFVRLAPHERVTDEARDLVVRDRLCSLERRDAEHEQVDRPVLLRIVVQRLGEEPGAGEPGGERAHDRGVRLVGRLGAYSHPGTLSPVAELKTSSSYQPTGDQPTAIDTLVAGLEAGDRFQTLIGATGTGKTATMAWTIEKVGRPALVIAHNKTLAAQLCNEFREFFPHNAVEYFVSYYDYYQPEAYVPQADLYIEKDSSQNDDIAR